MPDHIVLDMIHDDGNGYITPHTPSHTNIVVTITN